MSDISIAWYALPRCRRCRRRRSKPKRATTTATKAEPPVAVTMTDVGTPLPVTGVHRMSWSTPHSTPTVSPAGQAVVHVVQTASLVRVAFLSRNNPPEHALVTSVQTRSEVAVGWAASYETLMTHGSDVALQTRSEETVDSLVS